MVCAADLASGVEPSLDLTGVLSSRTEAPPPLGSSGEQPTCWDYFLGPRGGEVAEVPAAPGEAATASVLVSTETNSNSFDHLNKLGNSLFNALGNPVN